MQQKMLKKIDQKKKEREERKKQREESNKQIDQEGQENEEGRANKRKVSESEVQPPSKKSGKAGTSTICCKSILVLCLRHSSSAMD